MLCKWGPDKIASKSGLSRSTVQRVSASHWDGIRIGVAQKFLTGMGYTWGSTKEIRRRIRALKGGGIGAVKHLNVSGKAPLWKRGSAGNTKKFLIKVIGNQQ